MKFDKDIAIGVLICVLVLFGWEPFCRFMGWTAPPPPAARPAPALGAAPAADVPAPRPSPEADGGGASGADAESRPPLEELPAIVMENEDLLFSFSPNAGAADHIVLKNCRTADLHDPVVLPQRLSSSLKHPGMQPGALGVFAPGETWDTVSAARDHSAPQGTLRLVRAVSSREHGGFGVVQEWKLGGGHSVDYTVTVTNRGSHALRFPKLVISDGELQQWGAVSGDKIRNDGMRLDYRTADGRLNNISADGKDDDFFRPVAEPVSWAALSNRYCISIIQGERPFRLHRDRIAARPPYSYVVSAGAEYSDVEVPPSGSVTWKFRFYTGPKIAASLNAFAPDAGRTLHLAWGPLDHLAHWMLWALIQLKHFCGSYGWSIILLTLIVRLLFWPVTARANASMKKMSAVQPKIQELRTRYKDNPQLLNTKMMELYRSEKINPLGGCLPILLQIPVFFALYATLNGAVELRQVSFLWARDLAAADTVAHVLGLPVNPLVLAMTGLMVLQQHITPSAMDPVQKKMMLAMPLVMLFFLYDLPSGLTLYWTVSQIFSILQLLLQQKFKPKKAAAATGPTRQTPPSRR